MHTKTMKLFSIIIAFFLLNSFNQRNMHPVHISIVNIDFKETEQIFEISIKLFTDDFEKILNQTFHTSLNIGKINEHEKCNEFINMYIKKHLTFQINNKNLLQNPQIIKKKVNFEENSTWLYYKVNYKDGKKVHIINTLLNELYNDQKNLFIFTFKNTQEAFKFEKNKTNFEFLIK